MYQKTRKRSNVAFSGVFENFLLIAVSPKMWSRLVSLSLFVKFMSPRDLFCRYRPQVLVWSFYNYLVKISLVVNCVKMSPKVFKIGCFVKWLILSINILKIRIWMVNLSFKISLEVLSIVRTDWLGFPFKISFCLL